MPTVPVEVEVEVYCAGCGAGLCGQTDYKETRNRGAHSFRVSPCERCLESAREEGYDKGYDKGYQEAEKARE